MKKKFLAGCILCILISLFIACDDWETTSDGNGTIITGDDGTGNDWDELAYGSSFQICDEWETISDGNGTIITDYDGTGNDWDELAYNPSCRINADLESNIGMVVTLVDTSGLELTVNINNQSEHVIVTGLHFSIDFFDGNDWRTAPWQGGFPPPFIDIGFWISPDESLDLTKDLNLFEPLKPGLYRIRKSVFIDEVPVVSTHDITAEFHWE